MPSPFPGMDPYLEHPALWRGVHHRLITYIADTLSAQLPQRYVADIGERLYVVETERDIYPDSLVKRKRAPRRSSKTKPAARAVALQCDPAVRVALEPETLPEGFIEIRLVDSEGRVVTVIEVLSPTNKAAGSRNRDQYLAKQQELLQSSVHLLEIDLLRGGCYTAAAPRQHLRRRADWDYLCSLHRGSDRECETWPVTLRQSLPRVAVPLTAGDRDSVLDLQAMLTHCYDAGHYHRQIDYGQEPVVPFTPDDAVWADELLREQGLRR